MFVQRPRPLPLRQLDLELDEAWAARNSGDAADTPADNATTSSSSSSSSPSSNGSHQESATDGEHLGLTAWPTEDGGLTSFSYSLDLEWPEHLQSALHPRATQPSWKDLNQVHISVTSITPPSDLRSAHAVSGDSKLRGHEISRHSHAC